MLEYLKRKQIEAVHLAEHPENESSCSKGKKDEEANSSCDDLNLENSVHESDCCRSD